MSVYRPEFEKDPRTTMAWLASNSPRGISLADFGRDFARRRAEIGDVSIPRNAGGRRTPGKAALLAAIEGVGGKW